MPSPVLGGTRIDVKFPVVVIGASAGGLEACRALFDHWKGSPHFAFIIVQHLDPTHESMLVPLLATHTNLPVTEVEDGAPLVAGVVQVIAPGKYITVENELFRSTNPAPGLGVRLPLDALLLSLAKREADHCSCIILSGTGADGSGGLAALKQGGGFIVAQDPAEAQFNDMPRNAILTGMVDRILPVKNIPAAVIAHYSHHSLADAVPNPATIQKPEDIRPILDWLHLKTNHDFRYYKAGTLTRRIDRRLQMLTNIPDKASYLEKLKVDPVETALLAQDLLINVTGFFRDPEVFDYLAKQTIPELLSKHKEGKPIRIWVAGCSTGEEAYSFVILMLEAYAAQGQRPNMQIFASDADSDAIDFARSGHYPPSIKDQISQERLARYFIKSKTGFQANPELRNFIVFTVHDVLTAPPFARLDLVLCRNLLIYLMPEAQKRLLGLFHFALVPDGLLLLGTAETAGSTNSIFVPLHKPVRLFRRNAKFKPAAGLFMTKETKVPMAPPTDEKQMSQTELDYEAICHKLVLENLIPAAVLINQKNEWLYAMGPTEKYLRPASGYPSQDLLDLVSSSLRGDLLSTILEARSSNMKTSRLCRKLSDQATGLAVRMTALPASEEYEMLMLVGFADEPLLQSSSASLSGEGIPDRVGRLEHELAAANSDLASAILNLEISKKEQAAINAEATSVNEEYQSANEELLTSKEELQSLNEELTALNTQLQETLELHRTTSNDLQNVLYSTNVATIFLDRDLHIRFFTPATKSLFNVIAGDLGRPLSDLSSLASDSNLLDDARIVLSTGQVKDREIRARAGEWFIRRIVPYLAQDGSTEGVVITFVDVTERHHVADDLGAAKHAAETATIAKSRFLAAASHDLRQPLQTLSLLHGLLATMVEGDKAVKLVERFGTTLASMSGMLSTLLDINQIEAGTVRPEPVRFSINELFARLKDEFSAHATAQGLLLKVVPCNLELHTDPRLLEQMLRNLLSNALKYTKRGKILLGCRRRQGHISIEIWDTGIGIPDAELKAIFQEYHQLDNPARERGRGLGLGLAIVQSLVNLLGYKVHVRSSLGKGSVFAIEIVLPTDDDPAEVSPREVTVNTAKIQQPPKGRRVLIIEDDPDIRELLELFLSGEGFHTMTTADGEAALELIKTTSFIPDLIMADYNLPNALNGVELAATLRKRLDIQIPAIILTGDISTLTARGIQLKGCIQLNKPVRLKQLMQSINRLLSIADDYAGTKPTQAAQPGSRVVYVVDDDDMIRATLRDMLELNGFQVADYASSEDFLNVDHSAVDACLLVDAYLPGMDGLQLIETLNQRNQILPSIMITGRSDVAMAVSAMKAGAADFFEKPIAAPELLASIERVFERSKDANKAHAWHQSAMDHVAGLTVRQREIMDLVLAGHPSKNIAADLGISQRTVENHRAAVMKKTGSKSLPALARLALAAAEPTAR